VVYPPGEPSPAHRMTPVHLLEKILKTIRHLPLLEKLDPLWHYLAKPYARFAKTLYPSGVEWQVHEGDRLLLLSQHLPALHYHEGELWKSIMPLASPNSIIADVGANIGIYTVALANRVGAHGKVFAFEPDPDNFEILKNHVALNRISDRVELINAALGERDGSVGFMKGRGSESHVSPTVSEETSHVRCIRLDSVFQGQRVDLLKIDVEGYEEKVLAGGDSLLRDPIRSPKAIFIEVHPYAWPELGTSSESLLSLLASCGYRVFSLSGTSINKIDFYGEIVARR